MLRTVKNPKPDNWRFEEDIFRIWFVLLFPIGWKTGSSWTSAGVLSGTQQTPQRRASEMPCHVVWATAAHRIPRLLDGTCGKNRARLWDLEKAVLGNQLSTLPPGDAKARALRWPLKSMPEGSSSLLCGSWTSPFLITKDQRTITGARTGSTRWVRKSKSLPSQTSRGFIYAREILWHAL